MMLPVGFKARVRRNPLNTAAVRALLFGMNEPGFLFDFSDVNCMFQDTAGTLPVTAVGQSVALVLDKSRGAGYTGYTLGPELIPNGDFSAGSSGWTVGTDWTISGGRASRGPNATASNLSAGTGVIAGRTYNITWTQGPEGLAVYLGNASGPLVANVVGAGTHTRTVVATVSGGILFRANVSVSYLDNISVREVILGQFTGLGPELVANGTFDTDTAGWTAGTGISLSVVSGALRITRGATGNEQAYQNITTVVGRTYRYSATYTGESDNDTERLEIRIGTSPSDNSILTGVFPNVGSVITRVFVATSTTTTLRFLIRDGASGDFISIDNISVRELPGNHATQATLAARPLYAVHPVTGIRNELTFTEQFDNAAWVKTRSTISSNVADDPRGFPSADLLTTNLASGSKVVATNAFTTPTANSQAVFSVYLKAAGSGSNIRLEVGSGVNNGSVNFNLLTGSVVSGPAVLGTVTQASVSVESLPNNWYRLAITITYGPSWTGTTNVAIIDNNTQSTDTSIGILVSSAQYERGPIATTYQRVATRADITESVVRGLPHLLFDGIDDFLVTPTITPNTDKAQVIAGVRKLSDATVGTIIEHSATTVSNAGSFGLFSPRVVATGNYGSHLRGQARLEYITAASFSAPKSDVVTALYDIAESAADAENRVRINGVAQTLSVVDSQVGPAGTGNFGAYQTFIGRRGGTSLPFNGRVYAMTTRFGTTPIDTIINRVENWANTLTLAY